MATNEFRQHLEKEFTDQAQAFFDEHAEKDVKTFLNEKSNDQTLKNCAKACKIMMVEIGAKLVYLEAPRFLLDLLTLTEQDDNGQPVSGFMLSVRSLYLELVQTCPNALSTSMKSLPLDALAATLNQPHCRETLTVAHQVHYYPELGKFGVALVKKLLTSPPQSLPTLHMVRKWINTYPYGQADVESDELLQLEEGVMIKFTTDYIKAARKRSSLNEVSCNEAIKILYSAANQEPSQAVLAAVSST